MLNKITGLAMALVLLSLAGCRPIQPPAPAAQPSQTETAMPNSPVSSGSTDSVTTAQVALARSDLAKRLSIAESQITVIEAKSNVWRDSSLGCPEPGMMYAQALQDGMLIVLRANQKLYEYHSGGARPPFLCETPTK